MAKKKNRNHAVGRTHVSGAHKVAENIPKGLINVGNTCYFNSTLQCIARMSTLRKWIEKFAQGGLSACLMRPTDDGSTQSLRLNFLQEEMPFSRTFANFAGELLGLHNSRASITPEPLRSQLVSFYKQLNNFGQHDSHEALRCILDRLRSEEIRLWRRSILTEKKFSPSASLNLKDDIRSWGRSTGICTTIDRIFGGVLLTFIQCTVCKSRSFHFETFLDLSLPILVDECKPESVQAYQKTHWSKKKKEGNKGRKGKKHVYERCFEEGDIYERKNAADGEHGENEGEFVTNKKNRNNGKIERKPKKNKYGRRRRMEEEELEEDEKSANRKSESEYEQKIGFTGESDGQAVDVDEEDENTCQPPEAAPEDSNTENASLEPNRGSDFSDFRDPVDDVDVSNRSTGSPESVQDFVQEMGKIFDGIQEDNGVANSVNSSLESERKSPSSSISAGNIADMEDNFDETDGASGISSLKMEVLDEKALCGDFVSKSRIVDAGNETATAEPEEENEAKDLSVRTILSQNESESGTDLERCLFKFFETDELKGANRLTCEQCTKRVNGGDGRQLSSDARSTSSTDGIVRCDSLKRDLLIKLPAMLTIHLKRYQKTGNQLQKCNKAITFPINLDLRPYCSRLAWLGAGEGQYRLFGVVEHSGGLNSGHYIAYVAENTDGDVPSEEFIPSLEKPFPWPLNLHHLVYQLRRGDASVVRGGGGGESDASILSNNSDDRIWHYFSDSSVHRVTLSQVLSAKPYLLFYQRVR
ncbi:hypothetical protein Aperf_G00000113702 [Anoplocephala perfoliata]